MSNNIKNSTLTYPKLRRKKALEFDDVTEGRIVSSTGGVSLASGTFMLISFIVAIYSLFRIYGSADGRGNWAYDITILFFLWLISYVICMYLHYKTLYLYISAYTLALTLFHFGITVQQGIGFDIPNNWGIIEYQNFEKWLELSGWYTMLALGALGIGVSLSSAFSKYKTISFKAANDKKNEVFKAANWSAIGLLIAAGMLFIMAIASYGNLLEYSRADIYRSHADSRGFGVFVMIFPGAVGLFLLSANKKKQYYLGVALCLFAFLLFMLSGYRSGALFSSLIGVISWVKSGRRLPTWLAVLTIVFVLSAISFVGVLRTLGTYGDIGQENLEKSLEQTTLSGGIDNMGQTGALLAHVIRLVPETDPYRYGASYYHAIKDSIPNIGTNIDTEFSRKTMKSKSFLDSSIISQMPPSDWMTYRILKEQFDLGQGVGFTTIGEAYLNFGIVGVILFFVAIGFLLGYLDHKKIIYNPYLFIFCCAMLWPLIRTVRNDFANFIKPAMFMFIIMGVFWLFSYVFLNKKIKAL